MALIDVINVGQGDCVVINPIDGCNYHNKCIMVDTGDGSRDITKFIGNKSVYLFITHHDKDHFGGFKYFLGDKWNNLERIVLPYYQNELTLIAKAMLKLKGVSNALDCDQFIDYFNDIVNNQLYLKSIIEEQKFPIHTLKYDYKQIQMCCEGDMFCNHIKCLNPPYRINDESPYSINDGIMEKVIREVFDEGFANDIELYLNAYRNSHYLPDSILLRNLFIEPNNKEDLQSRERQSDDRKATLFFNFITKNIESIREFNSNPNRENYRKIFDIYKQKSHDVCTILKLNYDGKSALLTGDASKKAFNRLINKGVDVEAHYLKVPHHGSSNNLDKNILDKINPKVAIISHNNRRFGKSKDTHPNWKTLYIIEKRNVSLIVTNDVIKDGEIVIKKLDNAYDKNVEVKDIY